VILSMMACPAANGCTSVQVPAQDSTPPDVTMDVYGIPLDPPNQARDEEISVTVQCCDFARKPPLQRRVGLIAGGKDPQGIRRTTIAVHLVVECTHDFHTEDIIAAENQDPVPTPSSPMTTAGQAPSLRVAQGSFRLQDHAADQCSSFSVLEGLHALVHAEAENYHGAVASTKVMELRWP
jgi:hypothetical protein